MSGEARARTVVIGLGSPLQGDDGLGQVALERLRAGFELGPEIALVDGGTWGLSLLPEIEDAGRVLLLDAIRAGAPPGTLVVLERQEIPRLGSTKLSPHQIDLREVLAVAELRGTLPAELVAIGLEPARLETHAGLSDAVARGMDVLLARVRERLESWGHAVRERHGARFVVRGVVQGVGFRPWVARRARRLGLAGLVWNDGRGVCIEAFGPLAALAALAREVAACNLPAAAIERVERTEIAPESAEGFEIAPSEDAAPGSLSLAPDLAACDACLADVCGAMGQPGRHRGYAFTSCALCGPRFTLARNLPWDRARTGMVEFTPCADCEREHDDPASRRFGAEALACPSCGPRLTLLDAGGAPVAGLEAALEAAAARLRAGGIVAVQGVGGFHLACDATNEDAVRELRLRKRRSRKPFAVMAPDVAAALGLADLSAAEQDLLASPERPIVLARRREGARLAAGVAPGSPRVGLLLPYTPLHQLLLGACGRPLVMTSGNRPGDPIAHRVDDAVDRLGKVADAFLVHDRAIEGPCDDSVAAVIAGAPVLLRRSRGYVPRPIALPRAVAAPILACGAQLSNAFCLATGDHAVLSAHHGDLDDAGALDAFERGVARLEVLLGVRPVAFAHDLHPLYAATAYARARAARDPGARAIGVQHHHAHVASVLAEHGLDGRLIGLAWDGTGHGTDGAAWGGELLVADAAGFERVATFRPLALAGGDAAIRQPWRAALAALEDAFDGAPPLQALPLLGRISPERVDGVRRLLRTGTACVPAHGVGRYFDAVGALALGLPEAEFSGEVALAWNHAARDGDAEPYAFELDRKREPWEVDLRPAIRAITGDVLAGRAPAVISARFHATLVAVAAELVALATARCGALPVALTGGCFQNTLLAEGVLRRLGGAHSVYLNRRVPAGDGGIALGQAWVAAARLARGESD